MQFRHVTPCVPTFRSQFARNAITFVSIGRGGRRQQRLHCHFVFETVGTETLRNLTTLLTGQRNLIDG